MLEMSDIGAGYGAAQVLRGVSLTIAAGEVLCLMGRNGAGKSTTCKTIMGLVRASAGAVHLDGIPLRGLPAHEIPRLGLGYVPQGRRLFAELTVAENLEIGLMARGRGRATRDRVLDLFPRLGERLDQISGTLSGGEQQMLAIGRALCIEPKLLLLDEPGEGLQPSMVDLVHETVRTLKGTGVAILLVEPRVEFVLSVADRIAFLVNGHIAETAVAADLTPGSAQFRRHLGV